jgi:hypothetical protein
MDTNSLQVILSYHFFKRNNNQNHEPASLWHWHLKLDGKKCPLYTNNVNHSRQLLNSLGSRLRRQIFERTIIALFALVIFIFISKTLFTEFISKGIYDANFFFISGYLLLILLVVIKWVILRPFNFTIGYIDSNTIHFQDVDPDSRAYLRKKVMEIKDKLESM